MNNIDKIRNVSVYQTVKLIKSFKKTHKNENNMTVIRLNLYHRKPFENESEFQYHEWPLTKQ
jgi:hypothetical protein